MTPEIETFVDEMIRKYGNEVVIKSASSTPELLEKIPQPLRGLYEKYDSIEFPFGTIDSPEVALKHSMEAEPFASEGSFCFGFDGYFCFWLCGYQKDEDGQCFASWDHETEAYIEYSYSELVELLSDLEEEYEENNGEK